MLSKRYTAFSFASKALFLLFFLVSRSTTPAKAEDSSLQLSAGLETTFVISLEVPSGWRLNHKATSNGSILIGQELSPQTFNIENFQQSISVKAPLVEGDFSMKLTGKIYLCEDIPLGICTMKRISVERPVKISKAKLPSQHYELKVPIPLTARQVS